MEFHEQPQSTRLSGAQRQMEALFSSLFVHNYVVPPDASKEDHRTMRNLSLHCMMPHSVKCPKGIKVPPKPMLYIPRVSIYFFGQAVMPSADLSYIKRVHGMTFQ